MLRQVYGEVILKKGCILYHSSDKRFKYNDKKPMLFCTFHPNEFISNESYVSKIKLKKNVSLFFMIENIFGTDIISALSEFLQNNNNLAKTNNSKLLNFSEKLKNENFDGWFCSIENKSGVEVALINDQNIFEKIDKSLKYSINNINNLNLNKLILLESKYPICTWFNYPILNINKRYKNIFIKFKKECKKRKLENSNVFYIILITSVINYHKANKIKINW
jgi:hypothetical protein